METIKIFGKVLPAGKVITLNREHVITCEVIPGSSPMSFRLKVFENEITVFVTMDRYSQDDFASVFSRALQIARGSINLLAFQAGFGLSVILDRLEKPDGTKTDLSIDTQDLGKLSPVYDHDDYDRMLAMVALDAGFGELMNALIESVTVPFTAARNCARVIDGIKARISPGLKEGKQWAQLHSSLRTSVGYVMFLTEASKEVRHGKWQDFSPEEQNEFVRRAWIVMHRYFAFEKGGRVPLDPHDYPVL